MSERISARHKSLLKTDLLLVDADDVKIDYIKKSEASLHYIKENTDTLKNKP